MLAQGGATAISNAANDIKDYWDPIKLILKAVGGLVGFIGGLRVYNKWTNGDQDVNKEILGYGGAMIFLIVVPEFVTSFLPKMGFYLYKGLKSLLYSSGLKASTSFTQWQLSALALLPPWYYPNSDCSAHSWGLQQQPEVFT
jgi:hypothetical protein